MYGRRLAHMDEHPSTATVLDAGPGREVEGSGPAWEVEPVPHAVALNAEPLNLEPANLEAPNLEAPSDEELNQQISEVLTELIRHAHDIGQSIATEFGLTGSDAMALYKLDAPMTMKELGLKMGCDPSFITSAADALDKHGPARRQPCPRARRAAPPSSPP